MKPIDKSVRLTNYLIDITIVTLLWYVLLLIEPRYEESTVEFFVIMILYYVFLETIFGQTVGKLVTKTMVVKNNGKRANFFDILFRTILRIIPIDPFSFLFGTERGFHDSASSTKLILKMNPKIES